MTTLQALVIAVLQGATELFPVSSLGHAVVLPALLHWNLDPTGQAFLPFLVMLHVGTAAALLLYFWRDWWRLLLGVLGIGGPARAGESRRVLLLLIVATIPAVVVGGLLEHVLRDLFRSAIVAAAFLAVNGLLLLFGEWLRGLVLREGLTRPLSQIGVKDALVIGVWQCGALIPGISRSGATIVGGLLRGIDHEGAAHFSFLIALPIILGATALEVPKLLRADMPAGTLQLSLVAAAVAGVTAFASTAFLMRWFRQHDRWALTPFAWYCVVAGLGSIAALVALT